MEMAAKMTHVRSLERSQTAETGWITREELITRAVPNRTRRGRATAIVTFTKATGYPHRRAGENIAAGRFTVERLMKGWMDSTPHKRNILGSFSQIGVACATGESGKRYWCVTFGLPNRR